MIVSMQLMLNSEMHRLDSLLGEPSLEDCHAAWIAEQYSYEVRQDPRSICCVILLVAYSVIPHL